MSEGLKGVPEYRPETGEQDENGEEIKKPYGEKAMDDENPTTPDWLKVPAYGEEIDNDPGAADMEQPDWLKEPVNFEDEDASDEDSEEDEVE